MSPEHLHLMVNHIPILGPLFGIIPLLFGIFARNRVALAGALFLIAVSSGSVYWVLDSGEAAGDRYRNAKRHSISLDTDAANRIERHQRDAEALAPVYYVTAGVALVTLLICYFYAGGALVLSWIVILLCLTSSGVGLYLAESGKQIRRPDFRAEQLEQPLFENFPDAGHRDFHLFT